RVRNRPGRRWRTAPAADSRNVPAAGANAAIRSTPARAANAGPQARGARPDHRGIDHLRAPAAGAAPAAPAPEARTGAPQRDGDPRAIAPHPSWRPARATANPSRRSRQAARCDSRRDRAIARAHRLPDNPASPAPVRRLPRRLRLANAQRSTASTSSVAASHRMASTPSCPLVSLPRFPLTRPVRRSPDPAYPVGTVRHPPPLQQGKSNFGANTCGWLHNSDKLARQRVACRAPDHIRPTQDVFPAPHRAPGPPSRMLADTTKDAIRAAYARLRDGLPGFRARASQGRMIAEVAKAFGQHGGVAVIEAPTGTGKSMAYLIAGVEVARFQKKKLLIATATVAL